MISGWRHRAVCVKTSELLPSTSSLLAELFPQYLDQDLYRVVTGDVPVSTRLLELRWDHSQSLPFYRYEYRLHLTSPSFVHRLRSSWKNCCRRCRQAPDASNPGGRSLTCFIFVLKSHSSVAWSKESHYRRPQIRPEACNKANFVGSLFERWSGRRLLRLSPGQARCHISVDLHCSRVCAGAEGGRRSTRCCDEGNVG